MVRLRKSAVGLFLLLAGSVGTAWASGWQQKAVELAETEPKIHQALWSQDVSFWVSVDDDGSNRDGFAQFLCFTLADAGKPEGEFVAITVWDRASMATDNPRQLGKAQCK